MAFYKKVKQKGDDKWHPRAVTKGHPYTTDEIARLLSAMSTEISKLQKEGFIKTNRNHFELTVCNNSDSEIKM